MHTVKRILRPLYQDVVNTARELLYEQLRDPIGEANPEYERGIVEFIALGYHGTAKAVDQVRHDIAEGI